MLYGFRTVSKTEGEETAMKYDSSFLETSAADDFASVEKVVHELIRDIGRSHDAQETLQPLFISEDTSSSKSSASHGRAQGFSAMIHKRGKQTTFTENRHGNEKEARLAQRKLPSTFKIFNKRFNLFN